MKTIEQDIKQENFNSPAQKAGLNILFTANWLHNQIAQMLKPHGLSPEQYNVLRILRGQKGKPASVKMVNERMLDPMSNVSRLVDKLLKSNLVERKLCPSDRRQVEVVLTTKGIEILEKADNSLLDLQDIFIGIDNEKLELLSHTLDQIRSLKVTTK